MTYHVHLSSVDKQLLVIRVISRSQEISYKYRTCKSVGMSAGLTYSERLLFNANSAIFQLYNAENKLVFN